MESSRKTLEEAFSSIEEGNSFWKRDEFWNASESFWEAHKKLKELSSSSSLSNSLKSHEQDKIRNLYKQQSLEYLNKAQQALIKAMQLECDQKHTPLEKSATIDKESNGEITNDDNNDNNNESRSNSLDNQETVRRLSLFSNLFGREEDVSLISSAILKTPADVTGAPDSTVQEQQDSLEERLTALNKSLPSGFKTSEERLRDINRGLNRLGLSLYSNSDSNDNNIRANRLAYSWTGGSTPVKSEIDQVDDIIQQAKDEVSLLHHPQLDNTNTNGNVPSKGPEPVVHDTSGDSEDSSDDLEDESIDDIHQLSPEDQAIIREKVNEAQALLAQLNAWLAVEDEKEIDFDDENKQTIPVDFINVGKKSLKDARLLLQQAMRMWRDKSTD